MSRRWRSQLAEIYISLASKLVFLKGAGVNTLRHIKEQQDKDSQKAFLRTRPPEGTTIEYVYFRLFELFQIEDVDSLLRGLRKLFPNFNDSFFHGDDYGKFIQNATGITGGEWLNIGHICRERRGRFWGDQFRELKKLPSYVDYIHVELHKVLPSVFAITYDVHLEESATQKLIELQKSRYTPEIQFRKIIPYGRLGGGYSTNRAEYVMRRQIEKWKTDLISQVEKCLEQFLIGDFLHDKSRKAQHLPAIEVYSFKGIPTTKTALRKWIQHSGAWLESLGFYLLQIDSYTNGKLIFVPKWQHDTENNRPAYRIIVLWDSYIKSINREIYGNDDKFAVAYNTQENFLAPILPTLVIFEMLARFQEKFENTRRKVLATIRPTNFYGAYLGRYIKLNDIVLYASVLYDRISKDFQIEAKHISAHLKEVSDLTEIGHTRKKKYRKLDQELFGGVEFRINLLKEHVDFAMNWFSQYLALRNLSVIYFLALVAGGAAIVSLLLALGRP